MSVAREQYCALSSVRLAIHYYITGRASLWFVSFKAVCPKELYVIAHFPFQACFSCALNNSGGPTITSSVSCVWSWQLTTVAIPGLALWEYCCCFGRFHKGENQYKRCIVPTRRRCFHGIKSVETLYYWLGETVHRLTRGIS